MEQSSIASMESEGFTPEEQAILARIDPSSKGVRQLSKSKQFRAAGRHRPQQGGFIQALMPFLPTIASAGASLLPSVISGIISLFKKKKGAGAKYATGVRKAGPRLMEVLKRMGPEFAQGDAELEKLHGPEFWNRLHRLALKHGARAVQSAYGMSENVSRAGIADIVNKMIPRGLGQDFTIGAGILPTGGAISPYVSRGLPMVNRLALKLSMPPETRDELMRQYVGESMNGSGRMKGGIRFFANLKKYMKKAARKLSPLIRKQMPRISELGDKGLDWLIDKMFQIEALQPYESFKEPIRQLGRKALATGAQYGARRLQEFEDEPETPERSGAMNVLESRHPKAREPRPAPTADVDLAENIAEAEEPEGAPESLAEMKRAAPAIVSGQGRRRSLAGLPRDSRGRLLPRGGASSKSPASVKKKAGGASAVLSGVKGIRILK